MNFIVDIGNTRAKFAVIDKGAIVTSGAEPSFEEIDLAALAAKYPLERAILCSTRGAQCGAVSRLKEVVTEVVLFGSETPVPIKNSYSTPTTLGRDRLAAAVAADFLSEAEAQVVVDLGTAITIDLVTREGGFEGGVISPGVDMRFRALNEYTASLPLLTPTDEILEVARSTEDAIRQGVMEGVAYEIEGHLAKIASKMCKFDVFFTGGDVKHFENRIKNTIFASDDLIFVGLNRILEYNAK